MLKHRSIKLRQLIQEVPGILKFIGDDVWINRIEQDSRQVQPGDLFVAFAGGSVDAHRFIPQAVQRGAAAVLGTQDVPDLPVPYIQVEDSRQALAYLAAAYYDFPARKLLVIGVTGTDGKTTTASLIFNILRAAGLQAGMISTVNAVIGDQELDTGFHVTTPDALSVQAYLAQMAAIGATHVVLEATSHGLAQHRVDACEFDLGVITNITHEHLDYHGSYQAYRSAKAKLLTFLAESQPKSFPTPRCAVLNYDDASYAYLSQQPLKNVQLSYGTRRGADICAEGIQETSAGLSFNVHGKKLSGQAWYTPVETPLVGAYNVSNCLAALAVCVGALGVDEQVASRALRDVKKVPGRMEFIEMGQNFLAVVDFAHTPNALRRALEAACMLTKQRVIAVFGSAGLRDREKRRLMAETSADLADVTILTAEDPRTESLDAILEEMAAGVRDKGGQEGKTFWRVPDRGEAIRLAVEMAGPEDVVIVCGKGHEQSMCFGEIEYAWDDRTALRAALAKYLGVPGPEMPYLPTQD
jgi:UDP-N-acetylmuramoyl-L-alanyl-D-glutamate--2,6-diaminopimelate ligase